MRTYLATVMLRGMALGCIGCMSLGCAVVTSHEETVEPPAAPVAQQPGDARQVQTKIQLEERYDAAMKISSFIDRDQALSGVATDAANAGNFEWAWAATHGISAFPMRDAAARRCAETFDVQGNRPAAQQFADSISSFQVRDQVQRELASRAPAEATAAPVAPSAPEAPAAPTAPMARQ